MKNLMFYLLKTFIVYIGDYFPVIPRLFGFKILIFGRTNITNYIVGKRFPDQITYLVKSNWNAPLPITVMIDCKKKDDGEIQIGVIDINSLFAEWDKDVCHGEETFDPQKKRKSQKTIIPPFGLLKIVHYATVGAHPSFHSNQAFDIIPEDTTIIMKEKDFFNKKKATIVIWIIRIFMIIVFLTFALFVLFYFYVKLHPVIQCVKTFFNQKLSNRLYPEALYPSLHPM